MHFISTPSAAYYAPATFQRLNGEGVLEVIKFDCLFKRFKKSELKAMDKEINALSIPRKSGEAVDRELLLKVCQGWRVSVPAAAEGEKPTVKEVKFTPEAMDELEDESPGFIAACVRAFFASNTPQESAHYAAGN